jgi:hypothetical protein
MTAPEYTHRRFALTALLAVLAIAALIWGSIWLSGMLAAEPAVYLPPEPRHPAQMPDPAPVVGGWIVDVPPGLVR